MQKPTPERLRQLFVYDPQTGIITNKTQRARAKPNTVAGYVNDAGYVVICVDRCDLRGHHIAWALTCGVLPEHEIDHIDGQRANNTWTNLRAATRGEQMRNLKRPRTNSSGYKGVSWHALGKKWQAHIRCDGTNYYLGLFKTPEEAHHAYKKAAKRLHGVFARYG